MQEPTRIGAVVIATLRDRPQWGPVSWTRVGPAEPEDSTEPDYTPWVLTSSIEGGQYFHRDDPGSRGVGHYSWDQFEDDARLGGPVGDALNEIMDAGGIDGGHHKQWLLDRIVRILTEAPMVEHVNYNTASGVPHHYVDYGKGPGYEAWISRFEDDDYEWDEGIAP